MKSGYILSRYNKTDYRIAGSEPGFNKNAIRLHSLSRSEHHCCGFLSPKNPQPSNLKALICRAQTPNPKPSCDSPNPKTPPPSVSAETRKPQTLNLSAPFYVGGKKPLGSRGAVSRMVTIHTANCLYLMTWGLLEPLLLSLPETHVEAVCHQ